MSYVGTDMTRPSFFEMAAADRMVESLRPALQHILSTLANYAPATATLADRGDEIFYTMCFLLDRHYLKTHGASFAENFYCLKRVKVGSDGKKLSLNADDQWKALVCLCVVPYLRAKLERFHAETKDQLAFPDLSQPHTPTVVWLKRTFVSVYPIAATIYEGLEYIYATRYILKASLNFSPLSHFISQRIQRLSLKDMLARRSGYMGPVSLPSSPDASSMESAWQGRGRVSLIRRIFGILSRLGNFAADNAKWAVYIGVFLIRFLQWWYSPENQQRERRPLVTPPPPPKAVPHPKGLSLPSEKW
eukprot:CAMPEP_0167745322 /NCGR_PEP_ID=MMETSP0110_2-20121227/3089_1 /TAXON_ID=629695 /ORGANISM="Gymnochlora sp., Strain CCMP2014" /LENGTH=303 /DNA_ID=CAMNT_0007629955 /DNA_START=40 /DNA_END=948 /DNA_ORIENTATION=+